MVLFISSFCFQQAGKRNHFYHNGILKKIKNYFNRPAHIIKFFRPVPKSSWLCGTGKPVPYIIDITAL